VAKTISKLPSISAQLILNQLIKNNINVELVSKRFKLMKIVVDGKPTFIKGTSFAVNSQPSCIIANNKFLTKKVLRKANILVPHSYLVHTPKQVREIIKEKNMFPCVLKPTQGAHGNKVYANIESSEELELVIPHIFNDKTRKDVLVEEYIEGKDYRVLVVGDKVSAVMERIPAHVVGDGISTIRQLISKFNKNPLVGEKYEKPMCKIKINGEVKRILSKKGLKFSHILKNNERIFVRQNSNISTGGIGKDATLEAPSIVRKTAIRAAQAIGIEISGVDILYNHLSKKAYVIELNDQPGIDIHHFPVIGQSQNVAKDIVEYITNSIPSKNTTLPEITSLDMGILNH
jgi:cyanophycin synthetase